MDDISELVKLTICSSFFPEELPTAAEEAAGLRGSYWDNGACLKVHFMNGTSSQHNIVESNANEWSKYANLEFEFFRDPQQPPADVDIAIKFWSYGGGQSHIGRHSREVSRSGEASMYLPASCDAGVILHEFGHALGLVHEHLNPDAPIRWNTDGVYKYYKRVHGWDSTKVDTNVLAVLRRDQINANFFDSASIMIYEIPVELTLNGFAVRRNTALSWGDQAFIAQLYPGRQTGR